MSAPTEPSQSKSWRNAQSWAASILQAAREVHEESRLCDIDVGEFVSLGTKIPYNPWLEGKKFLTTKYKLSSLVLNGKKEDRLRSNIERMKVSLRDVWRTAKDENDPKSLIVTKDKSTSTTSNPNDCVFVRSDEKRDAMFDNLVLLNQMGEKIVRLATNLNKMAHMTADALKTVETATFSIAVLQKQVGDSIQTARRQLKHRDSSLCEKFYARSVEVASGDDGHQMIHYYLLAQDTFREYRVLLINGSHSERCIQTVLSWFDSLLKEPKQLSKSFTKRFLQERSEALSITNERSAKIKQFYTRLLSMNTCLFFRIIGMDVLALDHFIDSENYNNPEPYDAEVAYAELVLRKIL